MNINISKGDINEHLWLQRLLETRIHGETLRRAIEARTVSPEAEELWRFEIVANYAADAVEVTYYDKLSVQRYEAYTLAEVLRIAMTEKP